MTTLSVRLPEHVHQQLKELARQEGVSINQLITLAVVEKMTALRTEDYLRERAERFVASGGTRETFLAILDKAPNSPPLPGEELP